jgi:hypothetical protein
MMSRCGHLCLFAIFGARSGNKCFFGALTIVLCVDLVVGWDVGCCKIWTTWRQAEPSMLRLVHSIKLEQSKMCVLTVISVGIVTLIICCDMIVSVCFRYDPGYGLRKTSPDDLSIEEFPVYNNQTWDISCRSHQCIPANKQTNIIGLTWCKSPDH